MAEEDLEDKRQIPVAMEDLADRCNDFMPRGHPLALWYSFRAFLVLTPSETNLMDQSEISTISSAVNLALFNANCELPFLLEIKNKNRGMFTGAIVGGGCSTEFDVVHFNRRQETDHWEISNLSSLLHVFKSKVRSPIPLPVQLSVRLTYAVQFPFPFSSKAVRIGKYSTLPWGCMISPIEFLQLSCSWPIVSEDLVSDTPEYTDLDPLQAPQWSVRPVYNNNPKTSMATTVGAFLRLWEDAMPIGFYLSQIGYNQSGSTEAENPLDKVSSQPEVVNLNKMTGNITGFIDSNVQHEGRSKRILEEIENIMAVTFSDDLITPSSTGLGSTCPELDQKMKSCPRNSLVQKLTLAIFHALMGEKEVGVRFALLWRKFVELLRSHFESMTLLPCVESKHPQLQFSLLQQKVEMIQYCIKCKLLREGKLFSKTAIEQRRQSLADSEESNEESDDEFFDAEDDSKEMIKNEDLPEGREKKTNLKLLKFPDKTLYIPITQQPPPMTEDMLEAQQEALMNEKAENRILMQSTMLSSDMSAFKAANPGAVFEDFVRWHSPTDFSTENGLSARMTLPGNHWVDLWSTTKPEPVSRQKRVFDDTSVANDIFTELESLPVDRICKFLAPNIIHEALVTAVNNVPSDDACLFKMIPISDTVKLSQHDALSIKAVEDVADQLSTVETFQGRLTWLDLNFSESGDAKEIVKAFNKSFLSSPETVIQGAARGPIAKIILEKINDSAPRRVDENSPKAPYSLINLSPSNREYILRAMVNRPVPVSAKLPQRLYASVTPTEFRMAGAFSSDNTFFF